jgi:hypothetical protein
VGLIIHPSRTKPPVGSRINWSHSLSRGLVGCWLFNEGAGNRVIDISSGNHGSVNDGPVWVSGKEGKALSFDGTNDHINLAYRSQLPIYRPSSQYSVRVRFRVDSSQTSSLLSETRASDGFPLFAIDTWGGSGVIHFRIFIRNDSLTTLLNVTSSATAPLGVFNEVVWTDNQGDGKLYVNGVQAVTDFSYTPSGTFSLDRSYLATTQNSFGYLSGQISQVMMWKRVLSAQEVKDLSYRPFEIVVPAITSLGDTIPKTLTSPKSIIPVTVRKPTRIKPPPGTLVNWGHPLSRGLVGCWLFNEGAGLRVKDSSNNRFHGALTNMDPHTTWVGDSIGKVLSFDGTNDFVNVLSTSNLNFGTSQDFSVATRFKIDSSANTPAQLFGILGKGYVLNEPHFRLGLDDATFDRVEFRLSSSSSSVSINTGSLGFKDGKWHSVVVSIKRDSFVRLYIDNKLIASGGASDAINISNSTDVSFGMWKQVGYSNSNPLPGKISEVLIWTRALTDGEIATLHRSPYCFMLDQEFLKRIPQDRFNIESRSPLFIRP